MGEGLPKPLVPHDVKELPVASSSSAQPLEGCGELLCIRDSNCLRFLTLTGSLQNGPEDERLEAIYERLDEIDPNTFEVSGSG